MIKRFAIILTGLMVLGCSGKNEPVKPDGVLPKSDLVPLLIDLQVLESHFQRQFSRIDLYRDALDSSSVLIFDAHGYTKDELAKSLTYYAATPDTLFSIYEAAVDTINRRLNQPTGNVE